LDLIKKEFDGNFHLSLGVVFLQESYKFIDNFYNSNHDKIAEILAACDEHLNTLNPYISDEGVNMDSKKFDFILEY